MWKGSVPACSVELQTQANHKLEIKHTVCAGLISARCVAEMHPLVGWKAEMSAMWNRWWQLGSQADFLSWRCRHCHWKRNDWKKHRPWLVPLSLPGLPGETLAMRTPDKVYREEQPGRVRHPQETSVPQENSVLSPCKSQTQNLVAAADPREST